MEQGDMDFREFLTAKSRMNRTPVGGRKLVKQSEREACDINVLMKRWEQHGVPIPPVGREPVYGDFSDGRSYQELLGRVMQIGNDFMDLPAEVRKACDNDPGKFLDMCSDPARLDELRALGLVEQREPGYAQRMLEVLETRLPVVPAGSPTES